MTWHIRLARPPDASVLQRCARAAFGVYVSRMGLAPAPMHADLSQPIAQGQVHVAYSPDGGALGFVLCQHDGDDMLLETLAVWPAHAGQGVGRSLVAHVEALARTQGARAVVLYTNAAMAENLRFYPALGYAHAGRRRHEGYDRVFFRKRLA